MQLRRCAYTVRQRPRYREFSAPVKSHGARPGDEGIRACVLSMLDQQDALLAALTPAQYTFHSTLLQGTIGQHTRHSLDHLRKPLEAVLAAETTIHYDLRARQTSVETSQQAARAQVEEIRRNFSVVADRRGLRDPMKAAFMLSAEGSEFEFESTLCREMAFAVHHCIHHNALVKVLLRHEFPDVAVPAGYGMAPSTLNYLGDTQVTSASQ
ncbi:hypothetical protein P43SY_004832 [Pythium insidiosum]|uniref:DinB-like domain-containing protein n=1 Tax=Pythium insidiosum TaxID=114742 RepID=A0AAD5MDI8_PYTIN|nr:hypothetical protein P43SY_004832 [Pythium insidiosum]